MQRRLQLCLIGLVPLCVLAEAAAIAGPPAALLLCAAGAWVAGAGVAVVWATLRSPEGRAARWVIGPALGFGFGVASLLIFWAAGVQSVWALLLAPLSIWLAAPVLRFTGEIALRLPTLGQRDLVPLTCALLLVPLITFAPYLNVRASVPEGEAYRAYFTADFIWAMSAASEIAKGDVPPVNPFHHGEPMRYYWMSHLLSGAEYRIFAPLGITVEAVLLVNGLMFGVAFVAFMYWLARAVGASPWWAFAGVFAGFLANSYEGADMIRAILRHRDVWETLRDTNIDAVTRWFYKGMAVDGLHRLLLYQAHHLTGYALALTALWVVALAVDVTAVSVAFATGVLLALALLFSTFGALIVSVAVALVYVLRLVEQRGLKLLPQCAILAGGPLVLGVLLTQTLGYTNSADGLLMTLGVNPTAIHNWPWVMFLSFGPLLLIGAPSLLRPHWARDVGLAPVALAVTAVAFYFLVDVPDMGGVWVGWRSGHMLLLAFSVAAASGVTALWRIADSKLAVATVLAVSVALALPTVAIDVYNAQDIGNRRDGAGFPWTLVITPDEREAFDWIREHTPPNAVIQVEPFARNPATWAYVPAFAERRMAAGLPISMIPLRPYTLASDDVRMGIFRARTAEDAHAWAEFLTVDYILIGDRERHLYAPQIDRMIEREDLFAPVFRNEAILLLKVRRNGDLAPHPQ